MADISSITLPGGGTYDLKDKNAVPKYGMGKNLLRNWYFVGGGTGRGVFPVNQRGNTSYTGIYSIDNWLLEKQALSDPAISIVSNGVQIAASSSTYQGIMQRIDPALINGKHVTVSALCTDGTLATASGTITITSATSLILNSGGDLSVFLYGSTSSLTFRIRCLTGITKTVAAAKLELGTEQTLAHQEGSTWVLNDVPDYEYELYRCITSTADSSDTYANKSLATRQDLTSIQAMGTTNTTGAAIPAGTYFYLNGVLFQAKTQIDVNATFTVNTNCEQVTVGTDLYKLDNLIAKAPGSGTRDAQLQVGTYNSVATMNFVSLPSRSPGKPDVYVDFAETYIRVYYVKSDGTTTTKTYLPS